MRLERDILKKYWGFSEFRPAQLPIIEAVVKGNDVLGLLTTGGGKSICFQVPALMTDGTCLVVSPLIALMKDQVNQLNKRKIPAASYYSAQSKENQSKVLDYLLEGKLKFLYISPERLSSKNFQTTIRQVRINLLVVDEAHCISQWGYDFRPSYLHIPSIYDKLPNTPKIALTATATPRVMKDIVDKLELSKPQIFVNSYFKPNLSYQIKNTSQKVEDLSRWIKKLSGSGLVYVNKRNVAQELVKELQNQYGISADYYHAGLSAEIRNEKQERWIKNPNSIMVTTNAFGMGIDNPNVNYVIHYHFPTSLEAYFQECGRAGRAGQNSHAIALISDADIAEKRDVETEYPTILEVQNLLLLLFNHYNIPYDTGKGQKYNWDMDDFNIRYKLNTRHTLKCLQILIDNELIYIQEAFYKPDIVQIIANHDQIESLGEQFPEYKQLIVNLIRTYEGIHFKKRVNLLKLAKTYHYAIAELKVNLQNLAQRQIIYYEPSTNKPTLEFLVDKSAAKDFPINQNQYRERRQVLVNQTQACLEYMSNFQVCRSKQLLTYLGENDAEDCKICDVCLGTKHRVSKQDYIDIRDAILENLETKVYISIEKLTKMLKKYPELAIRKVLDRLLELQQIEKGFGEVFRKR